MVFTECYYIFNEHVGVILFGNELALLATRDCDVNMWAASQTRKKREPDKLWQFFKNQLKTNIDFRINILHFMRYQDLTRLTSQTTSSRWQVDKEAIGLSRVQQFSHLSVARPYQIFVNSIFKHIHTTSINTIIWQFVPFIYHPLWERVPFTILNTPIWSPLSLLVSSVVKPHCNKRLS